MEKTLWMAFVIRIVFLLTQLYVISKINIVVYCCAYDPSSPSQRSYGTSTRKEIFNDHLFLSPFPIATLIVTPWI